ncbi:hypothetical protein [Agrococcus sp. SGAir0287]|uniref:hypothetical protein n=1 Tax=Agrococcus sp. SGAir0287 TaxID=2070347 RepID=UPI0010CCDCAB|nr:hypothetical protein [Agrococcus sp. SGAir0287]QCR20133.1 hypothetical protein C1N71_12360 [Agrococcus sp. SGAir0287]
MLQSSAAVPLIAFLPDWARVVVTIVVAAGTLVGIVAAIASMRRNRDLQDGAPPLPPRPWSQRPEEVPLPGPPSPVAPDDATLEQRLAEIDEAFASGRIDATERERARRALLGDDER